MLNIPDTTLNCPAVLPLLATLGWLATGRASSCKKNCQKSKNQKSMSRKEQESTLPRVPQTRGA